MSTPTTVKTTVNPFKYFYGFTRPSTMNTEKSTEATPPSSTYPPSINKYSVTSTKNPYDFKEYSYSTKPTKADTPKRGFFSKDDLDSYFGRGTTKSPFTGKGIKSLFKIGTYYSEGKSLDNSIRPDANSQQVQIEPARLVFSYQRNLTSGEIIRT